MSIVEENNNEHNFNYNQLPLILDNFIHVIIQLSWNQTTVMIYNTTRKAALLSTYLKKILSNNDIIRYKFENQNVSTTYDNIIDNHS